jgi:hypothetical protein
MGVRWNFRTRELLTDFLLRAFMVSRTTQCKLQTQIDHQRQAHAQTLPNSSTPERGIYRLDILSSGANLYTRHPPFTH